MKEKTVDFHVLIRPSTKRQFTKHKKKAKVEWDPFIDTVNKLIEKQYDQSQGTDPVYSQEQPKSGE
jgi:hypothetical protein